MRNTAIALKSLINGVNTLLQVQQAIIGITQEIIYRQYTIQTPQGAAWPPRTLSWEVFVFIFTCEQFKTKIINA